MKIHQPMRQASLPCHIGQGGTGIAVRPDGFDGRFAELQTARFAAGFAGQVRNLVCGHRIGHTSTSRWIKRRESGFSDTTYAKAAMAQLISP